MAEEGIKAKDLPIVNSIENNSYLMAITDMTENNQVKNISKGDFMADIVSYDENNQLILGGDGKLLVVNSGQIQSDWEQTDNTQKDYIKNKPDLALKQDTSEKAQALGYAPLDEDAKVPKEYLPYLPETSNITPFALNSGYTDSNGDPDLLSYSSGTLSFKVDDGTAYAPLVATPANSQPLFTRTSIPDLDMSGYSDGTYNVFVGETGNAEGYANTIYRQVNEPSTIPEYTVVGSPTVTSGVASGFTTSDYLKTPNVFAPGTAAWEINLKFTTSSDISTTQRILSRIISSNGIHIELRSGHFGLMIGGSTGTYRINGVDYDGQLLGSYSVLPSTTYYLRVKYTGTAYTLEYSTGSGYTTDINQSSTTPIAQSSSNPLTIGIDSELADPFLGSIDLNSCNIKISGYMRWGGYQTNDIWLDTSVEPLKAYKYSGSVWEEYNKVPIGSATVASGVITSVETFAYNQNGYNVNVYSQNEIFSNCIPDLTMGISKTWGTPYTADENGYVKAGANVISDGTGATLYVNGVLVWYLSAHNGDTNTNVFFPIKKGNTYVASGGSSAQNITFYPLEGAI